MVIQLNLAVEELAAWAERCPCHDMLQSKYNGAHVPIVVLRCEFGERAADMHGHVSCPMRGRRAPELAAGQLWRFLDAAWQSALSTLAVDCRQSLSAAQWSELFIEFARGKSHCSYILTMKLHNWTVLPWLLCGLIKMLLATLVRSAYHSLIVPQSRMQCTTEFR